MLTTIQNDRELRTAYEILDILADREGDRANQHRNGIKRAIREYRDRSIEQERVIKQDYDSLLVVLQLPQELKTFDQADAYFQRNYYREAWPSMYDCTGQIFTTWYKIFRRGGQYWAYHATAMDV